MNKDHWIKIKISKPPEKGDTLSAGDAIISFDGNQTAQEARECLVKQIHERTNYTAKARWKSVYISKEKTACPPRMWGGYLERVFNNPLIKTK